MSGIILELINSSKNINIRNLKFIYIPKKIQIRLEYLVKLLLKNIKENSKLYTKIKFQI